jgi:C-terminal processing protease CtpA/Prc
MGVNAYAGKVLGTDDDEHIYGLVFDALLVGSPGASSIQAAVSNWRKDATGVIIDHRLGNGGQGSAGTTASADPILAFVRQPTSFGIMLWRTSADDDGPKTAAEGLDLVDLYKDTSALWHGGSTSAHTDVPVALLITRDVSYSDLFAFAMKGAPGVRIFGPHPTNGAFSSFLSLSYGLGLQVQIAAGDTLAMDGTSLCGHGAQPDEVIWPLQSDIIAGKDTLVTRALQWVRSEQQP